MCLALLSSMSRVRVKAKNHQPSLRKNFLWVLLGNFIYGGAQWGIVILLAQLGSPAVVGRFALGLAVCSPIFMFTNLRLREIIATDARREYSFPEYLGLRLTGSSLAFLCIAVIAVIFGYDSAQIIIIMMIAGAKYIESISDVIYGYSFLKERMDMPAKSMIIKGALSLMAVSVLFILTRSLVVSLLGLGAAWIIVLVFYDIPSFRDAPNLLEEKVRGGSPSRFRPDFSLIKLRSILLLALPLGVYQLLYTLQTNLPRYVIEWERGENELGIFAAIAYFPIVGARIVNALGRAINPRLAKNIMLGNLKAHTHLFWRYMLISLLVGLIGVIGVYILGREILNLVYGNEYAGHTELFMLIMVVAAIEYICLTLTFNLISTRRFVVLIPVFVISNLTVLLASFWLIPRHGLMGAGAAVCIGNLLCLIGLTVGLVRQYRRLGAGLVS